MSLPDSERSGSSANGTGRALVPFTPTMPRAFTWPSARHGLLIAAFGLALGVGLAGAHGARHVVAAWLAPAQPDSQTSLLHRLQDEVGRLQASVDALRSVADATKPDEPLRGIRRSVDALKQDVEQVRASGSASVAQLAAKIDKADHDPSSKLAEIASRLDRMEHAVAARTPDPQGPLVADNAGLADHAVKAVALSSPAASPLPALPHAAPAPAAAGPLKGTVVQGTKADVAQVAAIDPKAMPVKSAPSASALSAPARSTAVKAASLQGARSEVTQVAGTDPKSLSPKGTPVAGWVLRDVYDGMALVEGRDGDVREVEPGTFLPGAGEVRSIERRGRSWVVLTSRGVIDSATF